MLYIFGVVYIVSFVIGIGFDIPVRWGPDGTPVFSDIDSGDITADRTFTFFPFGQDKPAASFNKAELGQLDPVKTSVGRNLIDRGFSTSKLRGTSPTLKGTSPTLNVPSTFDGGGRGQQLDGVQSTPTQGSVFDDVGSAIAENALQGAATSAAIGEGFSLLGGPLAGLLGFGPIGLLGGALIGGLMGNRAANAAKDAGANQEAQAEAASEAPSGVLGLAGNVLSGQPVHGFTGQTQAPTTSQQVPANEVVKQQQFQHLTPAEIEAVRARAQGFRADGSIGGLATGTKAAAFNAALEKSKAILEDDPFNITVPRQVRKPIRRELPTNLYQKLEEEFHLKHLEDNLLPKDRVTRVITAVYSSRSSKIASSSTICLALPST